MQENSRHVVDPNAGVEDVSDSRLTGQVKKEM
jgi:hypothetical protein